MSKLTYRDHDGFHHEVRGCDITVDSYGRHWIWSESEECNISMRCPAREDALLSAIDTLLFIIELRDARLADLQEIADRAMAFAEAIKPQE
jgi:hypothetical protein